MTAALQALAGAYKEVARISSIGKTRGGRDIWAVEIAHPAGVPPAKRPALLVAAGFEGDHLIGSEIALYTVDFLLNAYATDSAVKQRLERSVVYVVPRVNADGAKQMFAPVKALRRTNATITVGFLLGDATAKMEAVYPDVKFDIIDYAYDPAIPNVQGIVFNSDEAAFLAGYLAAGMAVQLDPADPQIGWVGGMQIPPVEIFIVGYESGMAYYNEQKGTDVKSSGTYVGDFEAPDEGKSAGNSLLDEGVDIIFGVGGKTGNGALVAVRERAEAGAAVAGIGVDVDQYYTLPTEKGILITSVEKPPNPGAIGRKREPPALCGPRFLWGSPCWFHWLGAQKRKLPVGSFVHREGLAGAGQARPRSRAAWATRSTAIMLAASRM